MGYIPIDEHDQIISFPTETKAGYYELSLIYMLLWIIKLQSQETSRLIDELERLEEERDELREIRDRIGVK